MISRLVRGGALALSTLTAALMSVAVPAASAAPIPGHINDITGNRGQTFAAQSLWRNQAAAGGGYCAGARDELPF
jgi:hypothetical protein